MALPVPPYCCCDTPLSPPAQSPSDCSSASYLSTAALAMPWAEATSGMASNLVPLDFAATKLSDVARAVQASNTAHAPRPAAAGGEVAFAWTAAAASTQAQAMGYGLSGGAAG